MWQSEQSERLSKVTWSPSCWISDTVLTQSENHCRLSLVARLWQMAIFEPVSLYDIGPLIRSHDHRNRHDGFTMPIFHLGQPKIVQHVFLVFNEPKRAHVTPLFVSLHWLPVMARIKFKTLMLAYRTATGTAPAYFHSLLRIYIPTRSLRSTNERRLVGPSQRGTKSLSRTFSFTVPGWWNDLPTSIQNADSLKIFKRQLKTHLFHHYLTSS